MEPSAATRTLSTADVRRDAVLEPAMHVFAERGLSGTPTTEVAKAAGISHAYLFRLFPTESDLAVAVAERSHGRIHRAFAEACARAKAAGEDPMEAMGLAYAELISDDELLKIQLTATPRPPATPRSARRPPRASGASSTSSRSRPGRRTRRSGASSRPGC